MKLLAIDCATSACSAALWLEDRPGPGRFDVMERGHGEAIVPMIREVMDEGTLSFDDLDAVAVTVGPGLFTGLRIGLAAARGIAVAAGVPTLGVTTLEAVAAAHFAQCPAIMVALGSRRRDVYVQLFAAAGEALSEPQAVLPEQAASMLVSMPEVALVGDAAGAVLDALETPHDGIIRLDGGDLPDAAVVARLAARRLRGSSHPDTPPGALYLRAPDAVPANERPPTRAS